VSEDPKVRALEAEVTRLREQLADRPALDLAELDELELTQLASETAVAIVRAAHRRREELTAEAERLVRDAGSQAGTAVDDARSRVEELRREADAHAERVRNQAEERADRIRADADEYQHLSLIHI